MFLKKHLFTILVIIFALIATLATYFAYSYRFTDPPQANFFDSIDYIAMGGIFVLIAKINLGRTPQHQNLAIFAAVFAGFVFSYAAEKIITLVWK
jgi:predicted membrane channel-forming protein YqfA (hemolysin III family)